MGGTHFTLDQAIRIVEGNLENHASPGFVMGRDGKMKIEKPNPGIGGELAKHKDFLAYAKKIVKVWKEEGSEAAEAWAKKHSAQKYHEKHHSEKQKGGLKHIGGSS